MDDESPLLLPRLEIAGGVSSESISEPKFSSPFLSTAGTLSLSLGGILDSFLKHAPRLIDSQAYGFASGTRVSSRIPRYICLLSEFRVRPRRYKFSARPVRWIYASLT